MNAAPAARVVDALIDAHLLDPAARKASMSVATGILGEPARAQTTARRALPQFVEVVAYLGGALVLAAGALFLFEQWGELGFGSRVTLLALGTAVLAVAGVLAARVPVGGPGLLDEANDVRRRLAGALFTFGGLGAAFLAGHVVDHQLTTDFNGIYWPAVAGGAVGVLVTAIGYRIAPSAVGVVGIMAGVVIMAGNLASGDHIGSEGDAVGVLYFVAGVAWLVLTETGVFRELMVARALGVVVTLFGAQAPVIDGTHAWFGYALTLTVVVGGIALYLVRLAWPYLAIAVIAVTLVVPEAVVDWTAGSLGAVGGVLIAGITLLIASYAGYRIRAEATD